MALTYTKSKTNGSIRRGDKTMATSTLKYVIEKIVTQDREERELKN